MKVKTTEFAHEVEFILSSYSDEVTAQVSAAVRDVAIHCLNRIRSTSPKRTGRYAKGWRFKKIVSLAGRIPTYIIHNATDYQLVHLLEFNHAKASGGRVSGIPHVKPAADAAQDELFFAITAAIEEAS